MYRMGVLIAVVCGCSMSSVEIRDEQGRVRALLDAGGLVLFDQQGSERVQVRVGAEGRPTIVLRQEPTEVRLGATDGGWELSIGQAGGESSVKLLAPDGDQPYLKMGQVSVGYERRPARGEAGGPGVIETNVREMGLTVFDDEGRKRVFLGKDGPQWGLSLRDDSGRRRAEVWTVDQAAPVVMTLFDQDGGGRLGLGAERKDGGWLTVTGGSGDELALVSFDKVRIKAARGEAELATDGKGQAIIRVRADGGAQVEVGAADGGGVPFVEMKDATGEVQRVPAK